MARSSVELTGLAYEAERLVRAGESRADVSRWLGVHPQTLAGWALRGGWRKKDLDLEWSAGTTRRTIQHIRAANEAVAAQRSAQAERWGRFREAVDLIAAGGESAAPQLEAVLAWIEQMPRLEAPKMAAAEADPLVTGTKSLGEADVSPSSFETAASHPPQDEG